MTSFTRRQTQHIFDILTYMTTIQVLDDNSVLYAGTLNIGHDAKRQHRFVESSFRRAHNYSI